jgi:hypothetical protein
VKPKKALAFNKDTHFIFAVSMFLAELLWDPRQIRCVSVYTYDVHGLVAAFVHEWVEQVVIGGEDLLVCGSGR